MGDLVYVAGNPEGLEGTFSQGIVSGIRRRGSQRLLQITAPISYGSSGGPVVNERGRVIGVAFATVEGGQNLNFAIDISHLRRLMAQAAASDAAPGQVPPPARRLSPPIARAPVSVSNGTVLFRNPQEPHGHGVLTIDNGRPRDAVVTLWKAGRGTVLRLYVAARRQATAREIPMGIYRIRFALGADWDGRKFTRGRERFEFVDPLTFLESGSEYSEWTLSLHEVPEGTAKIKRISETDRDEEEE